MTWRPSGTCWSSANAQLQASRGAVGSLALRLASSNFTSEALDMFLPVDCTRTMTSRLPGGSLLLRGAPRSMIAWVTAGNDPVNPASLGDFDHAWGCARPSNGNLPAYSRTHGPDLRRRVARVLIKLHRVFSDCLFAAWTRRHAVLRYITDVCLQLHK